MSRSRAEIQAQRKATRSRVAGARALQRQLRALPAAIKADLAKALRAAAQRVYDAAKDNIPEDTGTLKRRFRLFQSKDGLRTRVGVWQRAKGGGKRGDGKRAVEIHGKRKRVPANYIHLAEFGSKPHDIITPDGKRAYHPGAKAQPFLMPAYRRFRVRNMADIRKAINDALRRAAAERALDD